jgi:predicted CXXCH cytochrome family protein
MHAFQMVTFGSTTPHGYLLNNTCKGCHSGTNTAGDSTPYVYTTGSEELAGGNFKYAETAERNGHNPIELGSADSVLTGDPPGWKSGFIANGTVGGGSPNWSANNLSCSGIYGCHGKHIKNGITGAHHNHLSGAMTSPTTVGSSYRFLFGIKGYEDPDYEYQATGTNGQHNVYYGTVRSADTANDTATISYFCAECHGLFHSGSSTEGVADSVFSSPWIRHPVDIKMPVGTSGNAYYYTSYNVAAPLASTNVDSNAVDMAVSTDRIVMCLSCHRAHASPNYAALRWDYRGSGSSWTNGCAYCHTDKN